MIEKKKWMEEKYDHVRTALMLMKELGIKQKIRNEVVELTEKEGDFSL